MNLPPFSRAIIASILCIATLWAAVWFGDDLAMQISPFDQEDGALFLLISKIIQSVIVGLTVIAFVIICRGFPKPHPERKQHWLIALPAIWLIANAFQVAFLKIPVTHVLIVTLGASFFVAFTEEFVFRYVLHRTLAGFSTAIYVIISSSIFGMMHYQGHGAAGVFSTMFIGATLDMARVKGAPMWLLIFFHALIDCLVLLPHRELKQFGYVADAALFISIAAWLWYVGNFKHWRRPGTSTGLYTESSSA